MSVSLPRPGSYDRRTHRSLPLMTFPPRILIPLLLAACVMSCSTQPRPSATDTTFLVVRHAEKVLDDSADPALTDTGQKRAEALAGSLTHQPLTAVYATAFRRTQQTAVPAARAHGLQVITYDAKQPAAHFVAQLRHAHRAGMVLVVGHSNTVPAIASALCACDVPPMDDTEYNRRMTIRIAPDGTARLAIARDP